MPNLVAPGSLLEPRRISPVDGIELLALTAQLRQAQHRRVQPHQGVPGGLAHHAVHIQIKNLLEFPHRRLGLGAEDAVNLGNPGDGGVISRNAVQLRLDDGDEGAATALAQGCAGIALLGTTDRGIGDDLHVTVVIAQNLGGVQPLLGQLLTAPLTEPRAGHGGAIAEFRRQGLHKAGAAQVVVEELIDDPGDIVKVAPPVDEILIVGRGAGDVEGIPPAAVKLRIHPVQGKADDSEDVRPQCRRLPGGVNFGRGHIFHIVDEGHRHIFRVGAGRAQVDGDVFRNIGDNGWH